MSTTDMSALKDELQSCITRTQNEGTEVGPGGDYLTFPDIPRRLCLLGAILNGKGAAESYRKSDKNAEEFIADLLHLDRVDIAHLESGFEGWGPCDDLACQACGEKKASPFYALGEGLAKQLA